MFDEYVDALAADVAVVMTLCQRLKGGLGKAGMPCIGGPGLNCIAASDDVVKDVLLD